MSNTTTWFTGLKPAFGMSASADVQRAGFRGGIDLGAARVRHIDALVTGATPGTPAWSPPDW